MLRNARKQLLAVTIAGCLATSSAFAVSFGDWFDDSWQLTSGGGQNKGLVTDYVSDLNILVYAFFTYNQQGEQVWITGAFSPVEGQSEYANLPVQLFSGGRFDSNGSPTSAIVGSVNATFGCDSIQFDFTAASGTDLVSSDFTFQRTENVFGGDSKAEQFCAVPVEFTGCPSGTTELSEGVCQLQGRYTEDLRLTSNTTWVVSGGVFIGEDQGPNAAAPIAGADSATLYIEPGTTIAGASGEDVLVIDRGSKIVATGTAARPIIMTSSQGLENGDSHGGRSEWGGLVINGRAPLNSCTSGICEEDGEGSTGRYGGNDPEDNSGTLRYVSVRHAGFQFTDESELNGISFQGVGRGTKVEYIHVHLNQDDGVEFYGGTVNAKYIALTGNGDDSLDWVLGWDGRVQYVLIKQYNDRAGRGIEADNLGDSPDALPRSNPTIANVTIIGADQDPNEEGHGMILRAGTGAQLYNFIITNAGQNCIDIDGAATFTHAGSPNALTGGLRMENSFVWGCEDGNFEDNESGDPWAVSAWFNAQPGNSTTPLVMDNYIPVPGSPALSVSQLPIEDDFFDQVDFAGAVRDKQSDWTAGWVIGLDSKPPIRP